MNTLPLTPQVVPSLVDVFKSFLATQNVPHGTLSLYAQAVSAFLSEVALEKNLTLSDVALISEHEFLGHISGVDITMDEAHELYALWIAHVARTTGESSPYTPATPEGNHQDVTHFSQLPSTQELCARYQKHLEREGRSHSTVKNYLTDLRHFFAFFGETETAAMFGKPNINRYLRSLPEYGFGAASIERKTTALRQFLAWAKHKGYVSQNALEIVAIAPSIFPLETSILSHSPGLATALEKSPLGKKVKRAYAAYHSFRFTPYLHVALLLVLTTLMTFGGFRQFILNVSQSNAFPSSLTRPNRILSFQARLTKTDGSAITTSTNLKFELFNAQTGGSSLWSGSCSITPDKDGIFSTLLGSTCGSEIASSVFTENQQVWLEVTVGSETLSPRQRIASVAYALNAETLQGYPPADPATINTIPVVNNSGAIVIAASSPTLQSTSGTFAIKSNALSITTNSGTGGNITIAPDGTGQVTVIGGTTTTDTVTVQNANLTTGNLITGTVANNNTGYKLLSLQSGSTLREKFGVDALGNVTEKGYFSAPGATLSATYSGASPLIINGTGGQIFSIANGGNVTLANGAKLQPLSDSVSALNIANSTGTNFVSFDSTNSRVGIGTSAPTAALSVGSSSQFTVDTTGTISSSVLGTPGAVIYASNSNGTLASSAQGTNGQCLVSGGTGAPNWVACAVAANNFWQYASNVIAPGNTTWDLAVGGISTASAKFQVFSASGNATTAGNLVFGGTSGTNVIAARSMAGLTLGDSQTGNVNFFNSSNFINSSGNLGIAGNLTVPGTTTFNGQTYTFPASGQSSNFILSTNGTGTLAWSDPNVLAQGANYWMQSNGALFPKNSTVDAFIGGQSTTSAKFAFINVNSGTPTASISGSTANIATYVDGNGNIGTTNRQTLVLGTSSTGAVQVAPAGSTAMTVLQNGNVGVGNTNPQNLFDLRSAGSVTTPATPTTYPFSVGYGSLQNFTIGSDANYAYLQSWNSRPLEINSQGNNTLINPTTGSVGIGTTGPGSKLDVVSADNSATTSIVRAQANNLTAAANLGFSSLFASGTGANYDISVLAKGSGGYIWLGQDSPSTGIRFRPTDTQNTVWFGNRTVGLTADSGNTISISQTSNPSTGLTVNTTSGNVGIGTTSPVAPLHISQGYGSNAALIVNNLNSGDLIAASASGVTKFRIQNNGTITDANYLNCTGITSDSSGNLACNTNAFADRNFWQIDSTSTVISPGISSRDLAIGGTATSSALFQVFGTSGNATTAGNLTFAGTNATNLIAARNKAGLTIGDSQTGNIILNGGNVGIGTTTPAAKLEVYGGNTYITNNNVNGAASGQLIIRGSSNPNQQVWFGYDTTNDYASIQAIVQGIGYKPLILQPNSGNVGIGTTSPTALFDVAGNASVSGTLAFRTGTGFVQTTAGNLLQLGGSTTGSIALMPNNGSGAVGIGTTTPYAPLQISSGYGSNAALIVNNLNSGDLIAASASGVTKFRVDNSGNIYGAAYTTQGGVFYAGTSGQLLASAAGTSGQCLMSGGTGTPTWGSCATGSTNYWQLDTTGKVLSPGNSTWDLAVGGTATSSALFQVFGLSGNATSAGNLTFAGTNATNLIAARNKAGLTIGDTQTGNIIFNGGNVGVGTTSPSSLFSVANNTFSVSTTGHVGIGANSTVPGILLNINGSTSTSPLQFGLSATPTFDSSGTNSNAAIYTSANGGSGSFTTTNLAGVYVDNNSKGSGQTVTNNYSIYASGQAVTSTNDYGMYIGAISGGSALNAGMRITGTTAAAINYGIYADTTAQNYFAGAVGLGTTSPVAPLQISSGYGSNAALIVNNLNSGDLVAASASGVTKFRVDNSGNVIAAAGTFSGLVTANGGLTVASGQNATLASFTSNGGPLYTNGSGVVAQATAGTATQVLHGGTTPSFSAVSLTADVTGVLPIANGGTNGSAAPTAGAIAYGTGTAYAFSAAGTGGQCLVSGGTGTPTWGSCGTGATNYWQLDTTLKVLSPGNSTWDLAVGGNATSSALFQVFGTSGNATTAGNLTFAGTAGTNLIAARNKAGLTIGDAQTGNIIFNGGNVGVGTTNPTYQFTLAGGGSATVFGVDNGNAFAAKNSSGTYENYLWPRFTDNITYLNYGASGFNIRNNSYVNTMFMTNGGNVGIGTTSPVAPLQISQGNGSNAAFIVNNLNSGDLIAASASGTTKFRVDTSGDIILATGDKIQPIADSTTALNVANAAGTAYTVFDTTNSRVGIGAATAPTATLQVTGSLTQAGGAVSINDSSSTNTTSIGGGTTSGAITIGGAATQTLNIGNGAAIKTVNLGSSTTTSTTTIQGGSNGILMNTSNYLSGVSIGTSNVRAPLYISSGFGGNAAAIVDQLNSGDILAASASGVTKFRIDNTGNHIIATGANFQPLTDSTSAINIANAAGTAFAVFDTTNSRLRLGSATAPTTTLDVTGTASVSSTLTVGGAIQPSNGPLTFNYKSGTNSWATGITLDTVGNVSLASLTTQGGIVYTSNAGGMLAVSAQGATGQCLVSGGTGAPTWASCPVASNNYWQLNSNVLSPGNSNYDLAIGGTATSSAKFQVFGTSGDASMSGNLYIAKGSAIRPADGQLELDYKSGPNAWAPGLIIQPVTGNVGIGVTNPTAKLDIGGATSTISNTAGDITIAAASGNVSLNGGNLTNFAQTLGTVGTVGAPTYSFSGDTNTGMYDGGTGLLRLVTGGANRLAIDTNGLVGIGTITPTALLHVNGGYGGNAALIVNQLNSGDIIAASSSGTTRFRVDNNGNAIASSFQDLQNTAYYLDPANVGTSLTTAGQAGIGTSAPVSFFHVNGTVTGKTLAIFNETGTNGLLTASASGTTKMTLDTSGNFSIAGVYSGLSGTNTRIQATGNTSGSTANGSIYFLDSSGNTRGRIETSLPSQVGSGADKEIYLTSSTNLNTTAIATGRSYADGIAYRVVAPASGVNSVTQFGASDALNNGIAAGDEVLLINLQGTSGDSATVGNYEFLKVSSVNATTMTFTTNTVNAYNGTTAANQQVVVQRVPQYTNITVANSSSLTASAFDKLATAPSGAAGRRTGIVAFRSTGKVTIGNGASITVSGLGYGGGAGGNSPTNGTQGDSIIAGVISTAANTGGGGGAVSNSGGANMGSGGGGGYGAAGTSGTGNSSPGTGGSTYGTAALTTLFLGSGGGGGGSNSSGIGGGGGAGGGIIFIGANIVDLSNGGSLTSNGATSAAANGATGGGGSGGSILLATNVLYSGSTTATAGSAGASAGGNQGGVGGVGRIRINSPSYISAGNSTTPAASTSTSIPSTLNSLVSSTSTYGTLYISAVNTSAADLAERYVTGDSSIGPGDVVTISDTTLVGPTGQQIVNRGVLRKATDSYDSKLIGVISTTPGLVLGSKDEDGQLDTRQLALAGRVPIKIDPDSPAIMIGDFLTSSNKPGYARKATQAGYVVAKALESWDPAKGDTTIMSFVTLGYNDPDVNNQGILTQRYDLMHIPTASGSASTTLAYQIKNLLGETVTRATSLSQAIIGNLTAGAIQAQEIVTNSVTIGGQKIEDMISHIVDQKIQTLTSPLVQSPLKSDANENLMIRLGSPESTGSAKMLTIADRYSNPVATIDEAGNASFSGTLTAKSATFSNLSISDASISGVLYAAQIAGLKEKVAAMINDSLASASANVSYRSYSSYPTNLSASPSATLVTSLVDTNSDILARLAALESAAASASNSGTLASSALGDVTVSSLFANNVIAHSALSVGSTLLVDATGINSVADTLSIQGSGHGKIAFLAGAMTLDSTGLIVGTDAYFAKSVTIKEDLMVNLIKSTNGDIQIRLATPSSALSDHVAILNKQEQEVATIDASGSAKFNKLIIASDKEDPSRTATISGQYSTNASTGDATLPAGTKTIKIVSPKVGFNSLVYVTPTSSTSNQVLYVSSKHVADPTIPGDVSYFVISIDNPIAIPVTFNWWVIN